MKLSINFALVAFQINFDKGKTSAVVAFHGHQAPELRRQMLLCPQPGIEIELMDGRPQWIHFVAMYKHLGSLYAASHSFEPELRHRLGLGSLCANFESDLAQPPLPATVESSCSR